MSLASAFVETLRRLLQEPALATKNSVFDASLQTYYADRVDALTPDKVEWVGAPEVIDDGGVDAPTGALGPNTLKNAIELDIDGFEFRTSRFRDGLQSTPRKIRRREPSDLLFVTPTDRVRYVLADPTDGVLLLDQNLEIVRTFPGLISAGPITGAEYFDAQCAATGTVAAVEHMAIACGTQHVVQIYNYSTGALVATIGTIGTPGLPDIGGDLTDPVSVAIDETGERLFIACRTGAATGGDASDTGFVCEFDISVPAVPVFVSYTTIGNGLYRLNNSECTRPSDVLFQPAKAGAVTQDMQLWIANGLGDTAAFTRALVSDSWVPSLVFEAQGPGYSLGPDTLTVTTSDYSENAIDVLTDAADIAKLYVAGSKSGTVEVFRASAGAGAAPLGTHEATYGKRGIEDSSPYGSTLRVHSTQAEPALTFGVFSEAAGIVADATTLAGESVTSEVLIVADASAGRVQRLQASVYEDSNTVTFQPVVSTVPVCVVGWFLPSDASFHPDHLVLEVRDQGDATVTPVIAATDWREVPQAGFSVPVQGPAQTRYQFRLRATVSRTSPVQAFSTGALGVLLRQQW